MKIESYSLPSLPVSGNHVDCVEVWATYVKETRRAVLFADGFVIREMLCIKFELTLDGVSRATTELFSKLPENVIPKDPVRKRMLQFLKSLVYLLDTEDYVLAKDT